MMILPMYSESASFLRDRPPLPPWGTLEAIEVPGYPQSHLQVPLPSHRDGLAALVRAELNDPEASSQNDAIVDKSLGPPVSLDPDDTESLVFYLHEDAWGRDGTMVGCLGLWRTEEERQAGIARIGAFVTHRFSKELLAGAIHCLLAHGQESWGWGSLTGVAWAPISYNDAPMQTSLLPLPPVLPLMTPHREVVTNTQHWQGRGALELTLDWDRETYHVTGLMNDVKYQWEGARRFYSSESGALSSEWYDESHRFDEALSKDMELCEEGVLVNGHYDLERLRSSIVPHLQNAIKRGVPVMVSMNATDLDPAFDNSNSRALAHHLEEMGATVEARPSRGMHRQRIIVGGRIFWASAQGLPDGYITRTIAEKQIPLLLIRDRRII